MTFLANGFVTQNETWISYKTRKGTKSLIELQNLANELAVFLAEKNISNDSNYCIEYSDNSTTRKYNVTIMVKSNCKNKSDLPYAANAID